MSGGPQQPAPADIAAYRERIRELEARLEESEDTLEALRQGDFDAVVVQGKDNGRQVYTLESADRPYRVLIEQMREGALTLGIDGTVLYCNRQLAAMLDIPHERLIGRALQSFAPAEERTAFLSLLREAETGVARGECYLCSAAGTRVPVYVSLSAMERENDASILCGVITDQTEARQHLRDLAEANVRLETEIAERSRIEDALRQAQKMEAVGQLTGGIAHDFNNLLTIIKSSTDLLRRADLAEERRRRYVDAIADTVDRASKLTSQLLAFARRQSLRPEVFDVGERVTQVIDMLGTIVGTRIRIEREVPREPCFVAADISQFETALVNLAVNARDAMNGQGLLTLRVQAAPAPQKMVEVSVTDTGCGIPPDLIGRIYEPFFTTKAVGKGTGLGLSQVFGFAKQSGGNIDVESEVGRGTTFTLHLPEVEGQAIRLPTDAAGRSPSLRPTGRGRRVLVVEDNVEVGTFATQLLEDLGYETTWASNAAEALECLQSGQERFDVVFSDVVMPGMNGVELAREIRRLQPILPIVLTSGYSMALVEENHGFDLLRKPYSVEQLSRMLRKATQGTKSQPPG